jgi:hypothetical protein
VVAVPDKEVRLRSIVSRAFLTALAVAFLIVASFDTFQMVAIGLDQHVLNKKELITLSADELAKLQSDERTLLTIREQQALQANPLDRGPLYKLTALARAEGKQKQADELILLAADRSLRDFKALADALPILLARHDFAGVLYRIDGLARSQPEQMPKLLPVLVALAEAQESRSALVAVLAQNPPWRPKLVAHLVKEAKRLAIAYSLLADLRNTAAAPTTDEVRALLTGYIKNHDYETGYFVWLDFLTDVELRKVSHIFDGGFGLDPKNLLFDWTYKPMQNVDLRISPRSTTNVTDRVLSIDFINPRLRFANLFQLLQLSPGAYVFSGEVKAEYKPIDTGLVWRLYCIGDQEKLLAQTSRPRQVGGWTSFELELEIPANGCHTQRLQLELDARAVLDRQLTGRVSYDNLVVSLRH